MDLLIMTRNQWGIKLIKTGTFSSLASYPTSSMFVRNFKIFEKNIPINMVSATNIIDDM